MQFRQHADHADSLEPEFAVPPRDATSVRWPWTKTEAALDGDLARHE
jgi:hypothetical protein